jgi:para-nitrobenzyl esterase
MNTTHRRRAPLAAACCAALAALTLAAAGATAATAGTRPAASGSRSGGAPIVTTGDGAVRGTTAGTVDEFLGIPYAAPPTGNLRWRPPQPPAEWRGVRGATQFAPSCPQPPSPFAPPGPFSEDCLYLNVYTPNRDADHRLLRGGDEDGLPVLVWIHGGGLTEDAGRNYDGSKLAADGTVVVTINYRLGALGFLAHPALASRPGGSAGNYGLMDQQAALRWVQDNIRHFGGDPHNVTIAGESAGGLSVLAQMVSPGARGLFQKAIIQSGSFALNQRPLAEAEAAGEAFAAQAGCPDQTAACLRQLPVSDLVNPNFVEIPGVVDGKVLTEPIGTALAAGQFARVPVLNGTNHDEERIFVTIGLTVSQGTDVPIPGRPVTTGNYQTDIAAALGVPAARAAAIAAEYPPAAYPSPDVAFSALVGDASFACPALQIDQLTSQRVPTYAYEFNDDNAPPVFSGPIIPPPVATHASELQYLFDLPNAPVPTPLSASQQALAASMRAAWANFAARDQDRALASIQRGQHADAVARATTTTTRDRLFRPAPLRILGRRVTTLPSLHALPAAAPTSAAAGRGKESAWPVRCRSMFSTAGTSRSLVARDGMTAPLPPGQPAPRR